VDKICALARLLAVLLAIVTGFIMVPMAAVVLLVLGGISAIDGNSEQNSRTYLIAIVLPLGAGALTAIPAAGTALATIFDSLGLATVGAAIVAITITFALRIKSDWLRRA
jgi:hypothetical protein